jgi:serine/threonine protein kinase
MTAHIHTDGKLLLDRYRIQRFLAEGGMQQVYVAKDLSFERQVALKVPKNASAEKRFARSARMSAKVNHSNVAKTLDYFEVDGRSYLVEELIPGADLGKRLADEFEIVDPHLAAHVIHHLAKGVGAAHHVGVVHRDLKPSNIMVSDDAGLDLLKITDFGIAKMAEEEMSEAFKDESSITGSQTAMGALPYMAPEMIESPKKAGLPTDIWAIGAILYRLIAGKPPYGTGLSAVPRIYEAKAVAKPPLLASKGQFEPLSKELWQIVLACLVKDPQLRPSADDVIKMCSRLCYSHSERDTGIILNFRAGTGAWGQIRSDQGAKIFFHTHSYYGDSPEAGDRVSFAAFPGSPLPRAFPVLPLKKVTASAEET